jgi:ferredoxin
MAAKIQVDLETCLGCGACVEACPAGLVALVAGKAVIGEQGCDSCLKCVDACPHGALSVMLEQEPAALVPVAPSSRLPATVPARRDKPAELAAWAAAALMLFRQEVAPRLAEALVRALDRPSSVPGRATGAVSMQLQTGLPRGGGGRRHRQRKRGRAVPTSAGAARARSGR